GGRGLLRGGTLDGARFLDGLREALGIEAELVGVAGGVDDAAACVALRGPCPGVDLGECLPQLRFAGAQLAEVAGGGGGALGERPPGPPGNGRSVTERLVEPGGAARDRSEQLGVACPPAAQMRYGCERGGGLLRADGGRIRGLHGSLGGLLEPCELLDG